MQSSNAPVQYPDNVKKLSIRKSTLSVFYAKRAKIIAKKLPKYLRVSYKSSTFAPAFGKASAPEVIEGQGDESLRP